MNRLLLALAGLMLANLAHAEVPGIAHAFFLVKPLSLAPVVFCPEGSEIRVDSTGRFCREIVVFGGAKRVPSMRAEEYLESRCPQAILKSLTPQIKWQASAGNQEWINSIVIGFDPPASGCPAESKRAI